MDMFIGFLSYTNDAVFEQKKDNTADISMLDETVLNALDIPKEEAQQEKNNDPEFSFLERLVEDQKSKRTLSNKQLMKRISKTGNGLMLMEESFDDNPLNQSFPDHFAYMKNEDSMNEMRPYNK